MTEECFDVVFGIKNFFVVSVDGKTEREGGGRFDGVGEVGTRGREWRFDRDTCWDLIG